MPTEKIRNIPREYRQFNQKIDKLEHKFEYNADETKELNRRLNHNVNFDICDLRRVSLWKLDRVLRVSETMLLKLREIAAKDDLVITDIAAREVIEGLVDSGGIGFPMASSILKFIRPDVFPIIDVRAYRALTGRKIYYKTYTLEKYLDYAQRLRKISETSSLPFCKIDEQLYCFDKSHNSKI